jgi:hypothetical protein
LWSVIQIGIIERGKKNKRTNLRDAKEHQLQFEDKAMLGGPKKDEDSVKLLGKEVKVSDLQGKKERKKTRGRQKGNLLLLVVSC